MDLGYELHDLVRTLDREVDRLLRPEGLTYNRYVALVIVAEHPGITGRRLAAALGVSEAAVSQMVRPFLADELMTNEAATGAGHVRHLKVTARGRRLVRRCGDLLGDALDASARRIGVDPLDLATTIRALHDEVRRPEKKESE